MSRIKALFLAGGVVLVCLLMSASFAQDIGIIEDEDLDGEFETEWQWGEVVSVDPLGREFTFRENSMGHEKFRGIYFA